MAVGVKHIWTREEKTFIKKNFNSMTNRQLADALGLTLTLVRTKCYELGLKRMELEYWSHWQVKALLRLYRTVGDKEIAEIFSKKWPKAKGWSHKHIEKKRKYLKLNRTKKQIRAIKERNVAAGRFKMCPVKAWDVRGRAPEGEIRYWKTAGTTVVRPFIKVSGKFIHWARHTWEVHNGKVKKGMMVAFRDNDPFNLNLSNLVLVTREEHSRRNASIGSKGLSDNYVAGVLSHNKPELRKALKERPDLLELKRQQLLLNRAINERNDH